MSFFLTELAILRADVDAILATLDVKPHAEPSTLGDDIVLSALFSGDDAEKQPEPARSRGKRHRSSHKTELMEKIKASKRQRRQEKKARKASIIDEQLRVTNSTTDGVVLLDAGTTEGDLSLDLAGSGKSDPPAC
uniref:Integrase core domain containing protein n=1 Tax=Solanum tuberosum TaxID=4113 RepID=M1DWJ4_SOLTU